LSKRELRKHILDLRAKLSVIDRKQKCERIYNLLKTLPEWNDARQVLFFIGFGTEVDTLPMLKDALVQGKIIVAPKVIGQGEMKLCQVVNPDTQLQPGAMGILEPDETCPEVPLEDIDLILVPAVAWDSEGFRVGYGGGYYDRLLAKVAAIPKVGIGFDCQLIEKAPRDTHDLPVDILITEHDTKRFTR